MDKLDRINDHYRTLDARRTPIALRDLARALKCSGQVLTGWMWRMGNAHFTALLRLMWVRVDRYPAELCLGSVEQVKR